MGSRLVWLVLALIGSFASLAHAGSSVAAIPDRDWYQASNVNAVGEYRDSAGGAAESAVAAYTRTTAMSGGASNACGFNSTASVGRNGNAYTIVVATVFFSRNGSTCYFDPATTVYGLTMNITKGNACPANALGTPEFMPSLCSCKAGFKADPGATSCVPDCTAGATVSSGFFDYGTNPAGQPPLLGCKGSCEAVFDGTSPAATTIEAGVKHYYAKGAYVATGGACTAALAPIVLANGTPEKPQDTCGANQAKGSVNGKTVCADQSPPTPGEQTDASKSKTETTSSESTTTNPDGSITVKKTTVTTSPDGGKETTVDSKTTNPDGSVTTSKTVVPYKPPGDAPPDAEKTACEKNPSGEGCGGVPESIGPVYTPKDKTFAGVMATQKSLFMASGVISLIAPFFEVSGAGSCPTYTALIPFLNTTLVIDQFCLPFALSAYAILHICLMVCTSFFCFRIAFE